MVQLVNLPQKSSLGELDKFNLLLLDISFLTLVIVGSLHFFSMKLFKFTKR